MRMQFLSWNVNGLMSSLKADNFAFLDELQPEIVCLQEVRTNEEPAVLAGYHHFWNHGMREGYAGTATLTLQDPVSVRNGFCGNFTDTEGRIITLELAEYYVLNVYVPNSQKNLQRQAYRREWDEALREYVVELMGEKPVILCGDFNVARASMDIFEENMRLYWAQKGYASDERSDLETLLEEGLTDAFRFLYPDTVSFTWWSNRLNKRQQGRGWRLDYFLISDMLMNRVVDVKHLSEISGSDHCPILLEMQP